MAREPVYALRSKQVVTGQPAMVRQKHPIDTSEGVRFKRVFSANEMVYYGSFGLCACGVDALAQP